ncbi:hypothetical protein P7K49_021292 [Saguinus oedipus]|uniref:Uncharacterized protein n=1 Tax=Saguinus oedipus TaxID=9490 RepID=A0ABQ9USA1_SAGOE|nr:hypothetical protein P7K49_021292 [Saguinus oedipus]
MEALYTNNMLSGFDDCTQDVTGQLFSAQRQLSEKCVTWSAAVRELLCWYERSSILRECTWSSLSYRGAMLPASREEVRDDKTTIKCETSPPSSPRALRLDRLHKGALHTVSHEDIRDLRK